MAYRQSDVWPTGRVTYGLLEEWRGDRVTYGLPAERGIWPTGREERMAYRQFSGVWPTGIGDV